MNFRDKNLGQAKVDVGVKYGPVGVEFQVESEVEDSIAAIKQMPAKKQSIGRRRPCGDQERRRRVHRFLFIWKQ